MPRYSVTKWTWCLGVSRKLIAAAKSSMKFTDMTEWQARGHDTTWRNSHSSANDLQHPLLFHLLVLCQSRVHWALFALPVLDPTKICHRSHCTSGLRRACEYLMPELVVVGFWKVIHHCSRGCCHPVQVPEFTSLAQGCWSFTGAVSIYHSS